MKILVILVIFLISFILMGNSRDDKSIVFYVHGGAMQSYKNDKIIVGPQGKITLSTISPTFAEYPNTIGQFESILSTEETNKLQKLISANRKNIKTPNHQPTGGSIVEELHIGNDKTFWTSRDRRVGKIKLFFIISNSIGIVYFLTNSDECITKLPKSSSSKTMRLDVISEILHKMYSRIFLTNYLLEKQT